MATHNAPYLHSSTEGTLGRPFELLQAAVLQELAERFDVSVGGLAVRHGDLAGTGTDVARIRRASGYGWDATMSAAASETSAISPVAIDSNIDTITLARYVLAYSQSFTRGILEDDGLGVEALAATVVDSYLANLRSLTITQAQTFSTNLANAAATMDVDDAIAVRAGFEETTGYSGEMVNVMLAPVQTSHLRASMRSEAALVFPDRFDADQSMQRNAGFRFNFLDMAWWASGDITVSGGDYIGAAWVPGAVQYVIGSTSRILADIQDAEPQVIPEWGIVVTKNTSGNTAQTQRDINAYVGVGTVDASVYPQFLVQSNAT